MKELTYEEWQKNPTPRMMDVWNYYENPVVADESTYESYKQYAEIEKTRRMTNKELSRWLREKPTREYKYRNNGTNDGFGYYVYSYLSYLAETRADEEVSASILIREDDGEWREPLVEVEK